MPNTFDRRRFNGGTRPNSGRRKTSKTLYSQKELRELLHNMIQENDNSDFKEIVRGLIDKAKSDAKVAAYVLDQVIGKPVQVVEVEDEDQFISPNAQAKEYLETLRQLKSFGSDVEFPEEVRNPTLPELMEQRDRALWEINNS